ncbi:hypothetical protein, partial [Fournierella sp.]|uniref:hypothetical protein n=1 Tax=Allofournierella sp. TaxID=1940256 RepID=UPI00307ADA39
APFSGLFSFTLRGIMERLLKKRSQNAQPQSEILRSKGVGGAALNKHCLRQYASLKNVMLENYALTA